jgi:hypothetical protein
MMNTSTKPRSRLERVGSALALVADAESKSMQDKVAHAVQERERAAQAVASATAAAQMVRSDKPVDPNTVAVVIAPLATSGQGDLAARVDAAIASDVAAGFSRAEATCTAIGHLTGRVSESVCFLIAHAQKSAGDHRAKAAQAAQELARARDGLREADLKLAGVLKAAELVVHTLAPRGSEARRLLKRPYTCRACRGKLACPKPLTLASAPSVDAPATSQQ